MGLFSSSVNVIYGKSNVSFASASQTCLVWRRAALLPEMQSGRMIVSQVLVSCRPEKETLGLEG